MSGSYVQVIAYSFYSIHSMFLFSFILSNLEMLFVSPISPFLVDNVKKSEPYDSKIIRTRERVLKSVCTNFKMPST